MSVDYIICEDKYIGRWLSTGLTESSVWVEP